VTASETPYRFESADGCSVVVIQPELNDSQWADFERVGNDLLERINASRSPACIIDLTSLNYMGSAMVALIVRVWKSIKEHNGKMVVVNRHEMVFEVLKLAGLHTVWTIVETREEGLKRLGRRGVSAGGGGDASGSGLIALGAVGAVGALVGLGLMMAGASIGHPKVPMLIAFGFAALGLFAGTMSASKQTGTQQKLGIAFVVASVAVLLLGILNMPSGVAAPPQGAIPPAGGGGTPANVAADAPEKKSKSRSQEEDGETSESKPNNSSADDTAEDGTKPAEESTEADKKSSAGETSPDSKADKSKKGEPKKPLFRVPKRSEAGSGLFQGFASSGTHAKCFSV
jgi:anti-anti-sigma factor